MISAREPSAHAVTNTLPSAQNAPLTLLKLFFLTAAGMSLFGAQLHADRSNSTSPKVGIQSRSPTLYALVGGKVITGTGQAIDSGVVLFDEGVIRAVGDNVQVPPHAQTINMAGKWIYPGLIESYSELSLNASKSPSGHWNKYIQPERGTAEAWNGESKEQLRNAGFTVGLIAPASGILKGTSCIASLGDASPSASIFKQDVAQHLRLTSPRGDRTYYPRSPMGAVALARQTFYDAAWYRQAWRAFRGKTNAPRPEFNLALEKLSSAVQADSLFIFDTPDEQYALRADRFAVEFGLNRVALLGSGREYQRLEAITQTGNPIIVPLDFPKPPNVATPEAARRASLSELMHWHFAPENPARLREAGTTIVFTTHRLKKKSDFRKMLRRAVERGLSPQDALAACTLEPARLFGVEDKVGSIAVGMAANLMVCSEDWLAEDASVLETWVDGKRFRHETEKVDELAGTWKLTLKTTDPIRRTLYLAIREKNDKLSGEASTVSIESEEIQAEVGHNEQKDPHSHDDDGHEHESLGDDSHHDDADSDASETTSSKESNDSEHAKHRTKLNDLRAAFGRVSANFSAKIWSAGRTVRLSATLVEEKLIGQLIDQDGRVIGFTGSRELPSGANATEESTKPTPEAESSKSTTTKPDSVKAKTDGGDKRESKSKQADSKTPAPVVTVNFPLGAYGVTETSVKADAAQFIVFEHATVWTCGPQGILKDASVLTKNGKIVAVGQGLEVPKGALRISAKGKHITPGIIDCHSHMATDGGVNEGTQAITAEVRIGDFIDATDISIYRQLAGGVTSANILHGSANPIGGQNQVIKLRWGNLPEDMKFAEAPAGIKFALGENVKQSNWGNEHRTRYPQSRLGVEQIMRDAFLSAKEYERNWSEWQKTGSGIPPRKDLELDAILQIANGDRWIHCHSYRQDEILALIRTLDDFNITIGTFQHILEGYKVAKEMAEHGAMGSSFSDWWGYKFEVYDAIPYNGAIMHDAGVVVSFNSDDAELARHLNHEAAKAIKYGGVCREEALKFVTLNPAKQLRIEQHVGSLEVGKDADLVVWNGDPLQITTRCEQTWIEGVRYFDIQTDKATRKSESEIRERLVREILESGETMRKPGEKENLWRSLFPRHDEYCGHSHGH